MFNIHTVNDQHLPQPAPDCPFKLRYETPTYTSSQELKCKFFLHFYTLYKRAFAICRDFKRLSEMIFLDEKREIISLFLSKQRGDSNEYPQSMF